MISSPAIDSFTEIDDDILVVTSLALNGSVDTSGDFTGSFTMRVTANGVAFLTGTGPLSGSVLGSHLSGTFTGLMNIPGGDTCQLTGAFTPS